MSSWRNVGKVATIEYGTLVKISIEAIMFKAHYIMVFLSITNRVQTSHIGFILDFPDLLISHQVHPVHINNKLYFLSCLVANASCGIISLELSKSLAN